MTTTTTTIKMGFDTIEINLVVTIGQKFGKENFLDERQDSMEKDFQ